MNRTCISEGRARPTDRYKHPLVCCNWSKGTGFYCQSERSRREKQSSEYLQEKKQRDDVLVNGKSESNSDVSSIHPYTQKHWCYHFYMHPTVLTIDEDQQTSRWYKKPENKIYACIWEVPIFSKVITAKNCLLWRMLMQETFRPNSEVVIQQTMREQQHLKMELNVTDPSNKIVHEDISVHFSHKWC